MMAHRISAALEFRLKLPGGKQCDHRSDNVGRQRLPRTAAPSAAPWSGPRAEAHHAPAAFGWRCRHRPLLTPWSNRAWTIAWRVGPLLRGRRPTPTGLASRETLNDKLFPYRQYRIARIESSCPKGRTWARYTLKPRRSDVHGMGNTTQDDPAQITHGLVGEAIEAACLSTRQERENHVE